MIALRAQSMSSTRSGSFTSNRLWRLPMSVVGRPAEAGSSPVVLYSNTPARFSSQIPRTPGSRQASALIGAFPNRPFRRIPTASPRVRAAGLSGGVRGMPTTRTVRPFLNELPQTRFATKRSASQGHDRGLILDNRVASVRASQPTHLPLFRDLFERHDPLPGSGRSPAIGAVRHLLNENRMVSGLHGRTTGVLLTAGPGKLDGSRRLSV